jgi:hypothetical protein
MSLNLGQIRISPEFISVGVDETSKGNGISGQPTEGARGFRHTKNFITTIYLRLGKLKSIYQHKSAKSRFL